MGKSPKDAEQKMTQVLTAWRTHAPDKTFAGLTLAQFEAKIAPAQQHRTRIKELNEELDEETILRDQSDDAVAVVIKQVVAGVLADPEHGPNSPIYQSMGYTREDDRKSGLHRNTRTEPATK
jgi:hypothetical protein